MQAPEQSRQHPVRQGETPPCKDTPTFAVRCDAATIHEAMKMRGMHQLLPQRVQHRQEADLGTEMRRVGGDGAQRLPGRQEQDVVNHGPDLKRDHRARRGR